MFEFVIKIKPLSESLDIKCQSVTAVHISYRLAAVWGCAGFVAVAPS